LVENKFGVLARIAGLFSARGFNIDSLTVGETEDPTASRMTIVVCGDDKTLEQVKKQLNKLVDVISVRDYAKKEFVDRELLLFRVEAEPAQKAKLEALLEKNRANVLHTAANTFTVEFVGNQEAVQKLLEALKPYVIKEMTRTGRVAMAKD
jgi:acetolactate synthase-1/3 small subunit